MPPFRRHIISSCRHVVGVLSKPFHWLMCCTFRVHWLLVHCPAVCRANDSIYMPVRLLHVGLMDTYRFICYMPVHWRHAGLLATYRLSGCMAGSLAICRFAGDMLDHWLVLRNRCKRSRQLLRHRQQSKAVGSSCAYKSIVCLCLRRSQRRMPRSMEYLCYWR